MGNQDLEEERMLYSLKIGNVIAQKIPHIYMDETTYNNQVILPKSWAAYR